MAQADYHLSGGIVYNDRVYIPIEELIKLCQQFPKLSAKELAACLDASTVKENLPEIE